MRKNKACALTLVSHSSPTYHGTEEKNEKEKSFNALNNLIRHLLLEEKSLSPENLEEWLDGDRDLKHLMGESFKTSTAKAMALSRLLGVIERAIGLNPENWPQKEKEKFTESLRQLIGEASRSREIHKEARQETRSLPGLQLYTSFSVPEIYDWVISPEFVLDNHRIRIKYTEPYRVKNRFAILNDKTSSEEVRNSPHFWEGTSLFENPGYVVDFHIFDFNSEVYMATIHRMKHEGGQYLLKILRSGDSVPLIHHEFQNRQALPFFSKIFDSPDGGVVYKSRQSSLDDLPFIDIRELESLIELYVQHQKNGLQANGQLTKDMTWFIFYRNFPVSFKNLRVFQNDRANLAESIRSAWFATDAVSSQTNLVISQSKNYFNAYFLLHKPNRVEVYGSQFHRNSSGENSDRMQSDPSPLSFKPAFALPHPSGNSPSKLLGVQFFQVRGMEYLVCIFNFGVVIVDQSDGSLLSRLDFRILSDEGFNVGPVRYENETIFLDMRYGVKQTSIGFPSPVMTTISLAGPAGSIATATEE